MNAYQILNTEKSDLNFICTLFDAAIAYQKRKNYTVWKGYDTDLLKKEIENNRQFKIVANGEILCVFSVCYADPVIWREMDRGDAIYLHRIVVNPEHKGKKQFKKVLDWAIAEAESENLRFIRMDTWADNQNIIEYYKSFGFKFLENYTTPDSPELAFQYRKQKLALLEYSL